MNYKRTIINGVAFVLIGSIFYPEVNVVRIFIGRHGYTAPFEEMCKFVEDCKLPEHIENTQGPAGGTGSGPTSNISVSTGTFSST
jgi:hypothetical protein